MERNRIEIQKKGAAGARRGRGRPRSEEANDAILAATIAQIRQVGYDALALDAVAARAGAGKATLYRRWSTKEALVADAIGRIIRDLPVPDTGSVRADLRAMMEAIVAMYAEPQSAAMLSALVAAMARSTRIADVVRNGLLAARRDALRDVLVRASKRGELRKPLDVELAIDLLSGALFYRLVVTGGRIDAKVARAVVDAVLGGIGRSP